ncbi:unnamed protein product [Protopolystoma xenopodis]|uniref:Uncharacterized protein n=1 Tax=Protopolystoma xenopodis TaxID=117903 RepID=A0A448XJ61_9PLAT|nr:unnamed protein product [Protopolystoma xenopodis]
MTATVTSPSAFTEKCDILDLGDSNYSIKFVPKEMGVHTVAVRHRGAHIPGSPFQFTVGPITEGGAHKVHASGAGLQHGHTYSTNEFSIYTREAGAGGLSIAIEGPSKAEIDFEVSSLGRIHSHRRIGFGASGKSTCLCFSDYNCLST